MQETFASALKREDFFANAPEVPIYFKLRTILFQTMVDLERRHLAAQKRDRAKGRSAEMHSTLTPGRAAASLLKRRTLAAQMRVSMLGKMLSTSFLPL